MPTVTDVTAAPPLSPSTGAVAGTSLPAGGFSAALAQVDLQALPSVGLSTMVAHRAGSSAPTTAPAPASTALMGAGPALAGASPLGGASPLAAPGASAAGAGRGAAAIAAGERYLGVPYRWGGTDPARGFDCSGFVQRAFADIGVSLPRVSVDQARQGQAVGSLAEARPGDLVFWRGNGSRPNHIGIYAGDGRMLVAPRTGDVVKYQAITRPPDGIRRVV